MYVHLMVLIKSIMQKNIYFDIILTKQKDYKL